MRRERRSGGDLDRVSMLFERLFADLLFSMALVRLCFCMLCFL
jgi:hypothetical protein